MRRFLLLPILLLSIQTPLQKPFEFLVINSCSFIHDNGWALLSAFCAIAVSFLIAMFIDIKLLYKMFFRPLHKSLQTDTQTIDNLNPRWEWFRVMNWMISASFLFTLIVLASRASDGRLSRLQTTDGSPVTHLCVVICFITLAYLVGFFGVSLIYGEVDHEQSKRKSSHSFASIIPPLYFIAVMSLVLRVEESLMVRFVVAVTAIIFFTAYVFAMINIIAAQQSDPAKKSSTEKIESTDQASNLEQDDQLKGPEQFYTRVMPATEQSMTFSQFVSKTIKFFIWFAPVMGILYTASNHLRIATSCITSFILYTPPLLSTITNWFIHKYCNTISPQEDAHTARFRLRTYNPPYPNGWYRLCNSDEIPVQKVKYIKALGQNLAVYRAASGRVHILDAYCPHLGANLAIGGEVIGENLQCPFHKWKYAGDGTCKEIPYECKIPASAAVRAWRVCEYYNSICVWFHAEKAEPSYFPPVINEISDQAYRYCGKFVTEVNMHIQEFAENSTDFQHFQPLHGKMTIPFTNIPIPFITINHRPDWQCGKNPEDKHLAWFFDNADLSFMNHQIPRSDTKAVITYVGPGGIVFFTFSTEIGNIVLFQTHLPIGPARQIVQFHWFADKRLPRFLVWYVVGSWIAQWKNDIMVWENKIFLQKPILVKADGPMFRLRRWFSQFYTESSSKIGEPTVEW
jgi:cholesterol 7-dehydrogenase